MLDRRPTTARLRDRRSSVVSVNRARSPPRATTVREWRAAEFFVRRADTHIAPGHVTRGLEALAAAAPGGSRARRRRHQVPFGRGFLRTLRGLLCSNLGVERVIYHGANIRNRWWIRRNSLSPARTVTSPSGSKNVANSNPAEPIVTYATEDSNALPGLFSTSFFIFSATRPRSRREKLRSGMMQS